MKKQHIRVKLAWLLALVIYVVGSIAYLCLVPTSRNEAPWQDAQMTVAIPFEEIIKGPSSYSHRIHEYTAKYIREHSLIKPARQHVPYNLTNKSDSLGQRGQVKLLDVLFRNLTNGFFVESGADDGEVYSNTLYLEQQRRWTGLLIEPNAESFSKLVSKRRKAYSINNCLSVHPYPEEVMFVNLGQIGSIAAASDLEEFPDGPVSPVQCFPFYSILLALHNPAVHLWSLDVEGSELGILKTVPWELVDIWVILVEVEWAEDVRVVTRFMESRGYQLLKDIAGQDHIYVSDKHIRELNTHDVKDYAI